MTKEKAREVAQSVSKGGVNRVGSGSQSIQALAQEDPDVAAALKAATKRARKIKKQNPEAFAYGALIERLQQTNVRNFNTEFEAPNTLTEAEEAIEKVFEKWEADNGIKLEMWQKEVLFAQALMHGNPSDPDRYLVIRKMFVKANARF